MTVPPNEALHLTRPSHSGCNPPLSWAGSLSLGRPFPMSRKIIIAVGLVLLLAVVFSVCLFSGVFSPHAPTTWGRVHAGMSRSEVLSLVGSPQQSGWPEKIAETWQLSGLVSHRRLFIIYHGESVQDVWDGTWVRGYGWSRPRRESL